jgi:hypothetical protein
MTHAPPHPYNPLCFYCINKTWLRVYELWSSSMCNFLQPPLITSPSQVQIHVSSLYSLSPPPMHVLSVQVTMYQLSHFKIFSIHSSNLPKLNCHFATRFLHIFLQSNNSLLMMQCLEEPWLLDTHTHARTCACGHTQIQQTSNFIVNGHILNKCSASDLSPVRSKLLHSWKCSHFFTAMKHLKNQSTYTYLFNRCTERGM